MKILIASMPYTDYLNTLLAIKRILMAKGHKVARNLINVSVLVALLGGRPAIAQSVESAGSSARSANATVPLSLTQSTRLIGAPVLGHRQPHARDVPLENADDLDHIGEEDAAIDRKLQICRGC
jgi:hypothetical protein